MKNIIKIVFACMLIFNITACTHNNSIKSPNSNINLSFDLINGKPAYQVLYNNDTLVKTSYLGFEFKEQGTMKDQFEVVGTELSSYDETWQQPWGENKTIHDQYNQIKIQLKETASTGRLLNILFRAYNEGVAFRYEFPEQENLKDFIIMNELSEFNIADNPTTWWIEANYDTYEKLYKATPMSEANWVATPVTMVAKNNVHISIHEAALTDYAGMTLKQNDNGTYTSELVPWANGDKVRTKAPMVTPWRTIQIAESASKLVESSLILNLNEPCKIDDASWIEPMKYIGIWWGMHIGTETWYAGPRHGAKTQTALDDIDFAAENNIKGFVVEGWNAGWENWGAKDAFDHITPATDFDLEKVAAYAKEKGVMLIGHHETGGDIPSYEKYIEDAFKQCQRLGMHAVKTGYAGGIFPRGEHHHGQFMVQHYRRVVEMAAKYQIMLDVHEPIKPTGIRRTWPNMMTREGVRGMEWNGWSDGNPPSHTVTIPFTRGLAGPTDYTPGTFDILYANAKNRVKWNGQDKGTSRVHTTLSKQIANFVILYSPLQMASDIPTNYVGHPAFQFFRDFNADSDESLVLNGEIGQYITIARRSGDEWYLGSATNEDKRTLEVKLNFLDAGQQYKAEIYRDAEDSDYLTNPQAYAIETKEVNSDSTLELKLAAGGGQAIRFVKQ